MTINEFFESYGTLHALIVIQKCEQKEKYLKI